MRFLNILLFHLKVTITKMIILAVSFPTALGWVFLSVVRRREPLREFLTLFDPYNWQQILADHVEALVGCRWFIEGAKARPAILPRYCYYDFDTRLICCLHLEDAVLFTMRYGGSIKKKAIKGNNAKQVPVL